MEVTNNFIANSYSTGDTENIPIIKQIGHVEKTHKL